MPALVKQRMTRIDYARGLAVALVVAGHAAGGLAAQNTHDATAEVLHTLHVRNGFRMPLLFLLAGVFTERAVVRGPARFLRDRVATLVWPYFLWNLVAYGAMWLGAWLNHQTGDKIVNTGPAGLYKFFSMIYSPSGHWFLHTLFLSSVLYTALRVLGVRLRYMLVAAFALYLVSCLGLFEGQQTITRFEASIGHDVAMVLRDAWVSVAKLSRFFFFLVLGAVLAERLLQVGRSWNWGACLAVAGAAASVLFAAVRLTPGPDQVEYDHYGRPIYRGPDELLHRAMDIPLGLSVALGGMAAVFFLAIVMEKFHQPKIVKALGRISLEIYVLHAFGIVTARYIGQHVLHIEPIGLLVLWCTAGGLALPLAFVWVTESLGIKSLFRFGHTSRLRVNGPRRLGR